MKRSQQPGFAPGFTAIIRHVSFVQTHLVLWPPSIVAGVADPGSGAASSDRGQRPRLQPERKTRPTISVQILRYASFILSVLFVLALVPAFAADAPPAPAVPAGDYVESFDTLYNSLTVQRTGTLVELRARSRRGEFLESAVDLADPLKLVVDYTRTLYAAALFQPEPKRVLIIGLGGAGFHRLFARTWPDALLQTVELDPKVFELCQTRLGFTPTAGTPVTIADGRMYVKRDTTKWDWLILDAFRGGYIPPHLKTKEFYQECAARLSDRGVFISNLHEGTELFYSDIKTIKAVFPQVVLFNPPDTGNVIAFAVNYKTPDITDPAHWADAARLAKLFKGKLDLGYVSGEHIPLPDQEVAAATVLTDDFAPVEFQNVVKTNNETKVKENGATIAP
jgi:spermidine synthase